MMKIRKLNRRGISLVEVVLTVALVGLVLQVVYSMYFAGSNSFAVSNNKGFSQQAVRNTSMFLEGELKYADDFITEQEVTDGVSNTKFYSLSVMDNHIVISQYAYISDTEPMYDVVEIKRFPVTWEELVINNIQYGKIGIYLKQSETTGSLTSSYDLSFNIDLLNQPLLKSNMEWNMSEVDTTMFYTKSIDTNSGNITLNEDDDSETGDETGDETDGETGVIDIDEIIVLDDNDSQVDNSGNYLYEIDKGTAYTIEVTYSYSGSMPLIINVDAFIVNPDNNIIKKSGVAHNGNGQTKSHIFRIEEKDTNNYKEIEITIKSVN